MPKRLVSSCGRSSRRTRRTRRTRLVLPRPPSTRCLPTTPNIACAQTLFSTPVVSKVDNLDHCIDASVHSQTKGDAIILRL